MNEHENTCYQTKAAASVTPPSSLSRGWKAALAVRWLRAQIMDPIKAISGITSNLLFRGLEEDQGLIKKLFLLWEEAAVWCLSPWTLSKRTPAKVTYRGCFPCCGWCNVRAGSCFQGFARAGQKWTVMTWALGRGCISWKRTEFFLASALVRWAACAGFRAKFSNPEESRRLPRLIKPRSRLGR